MPGVTVIENFTMNGTISGMERNFELNMEGKTRKLEFRFVICSPLHFSCTLTGLKPASATILLLAVKQ